MLKTFVAASFIAVIAAPFNALAGRYEMPETTVVDMPTASNGVDYELFVFAPPACAEPDARCPTLYLLDAEYSFPLAAAIIDHLSARGRIDPVIAVSIAYKDKSHYRLNRTRDYTPYHVKSGGYGEEFQKVSGGGGEFLRVIEKEIIPVVEARFGETRRRGLVGDSYGGLFATYAFETARTLFDDYIIVSPSLWYADGKIVKDVEKSCAKGRNAAAARVILEVGAYEEQPENGHAMVSDLARLNSVMKACASRDVETYYRVFDDETHASVFPAALSTGLRRLFAPAPSEAAQ